MKTRRFAAVALAAALGLSACRQDMHDQPRYEPLEESSFWGDGRSSRPILADTVARGDLRDDELLYTGKAGGKASEEFPFPVTRDLVLRGQNRFNIYCTPCHDRTGSGLGMIVRRGYKHPPSFHEERLRTVAPGYIYDVITNGFGTMPDYAAQVHVKDRWAIVAYIRALQLSQRAPVSSLEPDDLAKLDASEKPQAAAAPAGEHGGGEHGGHDAPAAHEAPAASEHPAEPAHGETHG